MALCLLAGSTQAADRTYAIAGQSNVVARGGQVADLAGHKRRDAIPGGFIWNNESGGFEPASLGINTTQPPAPQQQRSQFGPEWGMFERAAIMQSRDTHSIIKVAKGATSLLSADDWSPSATTPNLYSRLIESIRAAARPLECFVWVQGEKDRGRPGALYAAAFRDLVAGVRAASKSPDMRVLWVRLTHTPRESDTLWTNRFRKMQEDLAADGSLNLRLVEADDLEKIDAVHYTARSIRILGTRAMKNCKAKDPDRAGQVR